MFKKSFKAESWKCVHY